MEPNLHTVLIY